MGKALIGLVVSTLFLFQGCEAFKNYYDKGGLEGEGARRDITESLSQPDQRIPTGSSQTQIDFSTDKTQCDMDSNATISKVDAPPELSSSGWVVENGDEKVLAHQVGLHTSTIFISNTKGQLQFTVKQTGEKNFSVCNIALQGCEGECIGAPSLWADVQKASFEIYLHNVEDKEDKTANAGKFSITFGESNTSDKALTVEGIYFTNELDDTKVE